MDLGQFFSGITSKALNATASSKNLYCKKCAKSKSHTPLSYGEHIANNSAGRNASDAEIVTGGIIGRTLDYTPFIYPLSLGNMFFCNDCNRIRADGGLLSDVYNKNEIEYYEPK